jgi:hypothetical protein
MPVTDFRLHLECVALQVEASTDKWSVDRPTLQTIFQAAGECPDVDCFSANFNTICPRFFSCTAHGNSAGINFFMQNLSTNTVYFCCPPVHLVIACYRLLLATPNIVSYFLFPDWPSAGFWLVIFPLSHAVKSCSKLGHHFSTQMQVPVMFFQKIQILTCGFCS